jgi:hypothetical protein
MVAGKVMRLVVPATCDYAIRQLGAHVGVEFDNRQVVDVPLRTPEQIEKARKLQNEFERCGLSITLRNGPNAVVVYSCEVVDIG